ncbi:MAG: glycosyltransferase [Bacteroidaceae bacterium]|nr:glycosyltransferase [Bacteroidaceae bacterium]
MCKVSIIVPIYNASSYIEECLSSLVAQTMDDIEILLVDDHGGDDSIAIARRFVETHPSGKYFQFLATPYNMGPGPARNIGIEAARGKYVGFVDSDDVIEPDFCEQLYQAAEAHNADLTYCQAMLVKPTETTLITNPVIESGGFCGDKRRYFLTHYTTLFVSFFYNRMLLNEYGIRFPSTRSAEDSYFLTCSLLAAKRIACVDRPLYRYLVHGDSLSEVRNPKRYIDKIKSFDLLMQFAHEHGLYEANKNELDYIYLKKGYLLGVLTYIYNEEYPQVFTMCRLHSHLVDYVPCYKENPYYHVDCKLRLLHTLTRQGARLSFKILPWYIRKSGMKL